jgi:molecular chaperone DnaK (HSP70)
VSRSGAGALRGQPEVVVGIDLGTSHTSLAWAPTTAQSAPRELAVPQWVAGRRKDARVLVPSVAYAPLPGELPETAAWIVGEYARIRSRETIGRGISSAKSWLGHSGVDRLGAILPWGAEGTELAKLSPVDVSRMLLEHVRRAFEAAHPELSASAQHFVLTVPASFDQTARKLTLIAAERAGLSVRLLEEPQAAFYEYLGQPADELSALVAERGSCRVLICDIGGGTTDLSLIDVELGGEALAFRRSAVGRHLLLGGDNMDLALARRAEKKLGGEALDAERFGQLLSAAQAAKEALLSEAPAERHALQIMARGADLLGSALSVELERSDAVELVLDGFFPLTAAGELPAGRRSGLTTFGLPFERDPAITRHIWEFLERHASGRLPDALLLNGGVTRAPLIRARLLDCFRSWARTAGGSVILLSAPDPELAVCRGAVRYGLSLVGQGPRVEGGAARGYYVGVDAQGPARRALCVVPRGAKEGERHVLAARRFELVVGRPARFELYSSDSALHPPGALVEIDAEFEALPALTSRVEFEGAAQDSRVEVQLEGELSAVGTLELECTLVPGSGGAADGAARPRCSLEFALQSSAAAPASGVAQPPPSAGVLKARVSEAEEAVRRVLGKGRKDVTARETKDLLRALERLLGPKKDWDLELSRRLVDVVLACSKGRQRSEDHERVFWMLAGHCLRPGFGHPRDAERVRELWTTFESGLSFRDSERNWQQYWIAWRRVAGGLSEPMQMDMRALLDPSLAPAERKLKKPKGFRPQAALEMLELASHLERVPALAREELGGWLLDRTWVDRDPRLWSHLGRIGARIPTYASAHYVVRASAVERWVEQLLRERWSEVGTAAQSAVRMARVTGDRHRDLREKLRVEVADALSRADAPREWIRSVLELVPVTEAERQEQLGDDLPLGLRLID